MQVADADENVPTGHGKHGPEVFMWVPGGHAAQTELPVTLVEVPAPQGRHAVAPGVGAYV